MVLVVASGNDAGGVVHAARLRRGEHYPILDERQIADALIQADSNERIALSASVEGLFVIRFCRDALLERAA